MVQFANRYEGITGSAIRKIFALLSDPEIISFAGGNPSPQTFPSEEMAEIAAKILVSNGDSILQYGGTVGVQPLIDCVIDLAKQEDVEAAQDQVIILSGSSQGIELMSKAMVNKGDKVLVESPSFLGALQTFRLYEAELVPVRMDALGMDMNDLESKLKEHRPKFLYTIPTFQNPTGKTLPQERRKQVYELCLKYGTLVLEDDPYASLRYCGEALKPIKSYDEAGIVVKLMSFSKTISPGLRVGAAIANPEIIAKFNMGKQGQDVHTSNLNQMMVAEYIRQGKYQPHVAENCVLYAKKARMMGDAIAKYFPEEVAVTKPEGGMFMWAELPETVDAEELFAAAVEKKVAYVAGTHFYAEGGHKNTLRLNFTMESDERIEAGIRRLGELLGQEVC